MALEFLESCEPYQNIFLRWTATGFLSQQPAPFGRPGNSFRLGNGSGFIAKTTSYQSHWITGWAFYYDTNGGLPGFAVIYQTSALGLPNQPATNVFIQLRLETDATLSLVAGNGTNMIQNTFPFSLHPQTWYYIEVESQYSSGNNCGVVATLRVNGTQRAGGGGSTGVNSDLLVIKAASTNFHQYFAAGGSGFTFIKDLYIFNVTGTTNIVFAGDVSIGAIYPNGDVTNNNFSNFPGGSAFDKLNEHPPDDDLTYVYGSTVNGYILVDFQDIVNFTGQIVAVQFSVYARKDGEGTRSFKPVASVGVSPTYISPSEFFVDDSYLYYHIPLDNDPNTAAPWQVAGFNSTRWGAKIIS